MHGSAPCTHGNDSYNVHVNPCPTLATGRAVRRIASSCAWLFHSLKLCTLVLNLCMPNHAQVQASSDTLLWNAYQACDTNKMCASFNTKGWLKSVKVWSGESSIFQGVPYKSVSSREQALSCDGIYLRMDSRLGKCFAADIASAHTCKCVQHDRSRPLLPARTVQ